MDTLISLEAYKKLLADPRFKLGYVEYEGITLYEEMDEVVEALKTWEVRDDDSLVVTYPKAGTTWVQEIMSCVMHDGDLDAVNGRHTIFRVPYLEYNLPITIRQDSKLPRTFELVATLPSPRVIKSHLPGPLLPSRVWETPCRIVYVIRHPKDVVVSYFYFLKMLNIERTHQTFGEFFEEMMTGKVLYGPWWSHYLSFWKRRHHPNVLLLRFEDLKRDLRGNVEKISRFLGKDLSAEALDAITEHCTFANMKKNPATNPDSLFDDTDPAPSSFMRKGKVGDWKSHFTVAQSEAMDALIRDKLRGTGLTFDL